MGAAHPESLACLSGIGLHAPAFVITRYVGN